MDAKNATNGYPVVEWEGRQQYANRVICTLAHGFPPSSLHESAHSCKSNRVCCNPKHLRWATHMENCADREAHGTNGSKITIDDAVLIGELQASGLSQRQIAANLHVDRTTLQRAVKRLKQKGNIIQFHSGRPNKLTECDVGNIRTEYAKGDISQQALATFFDVNTSLISSIISRRIWAHVA